MAGFWRRLGAFFLDGVVLGAVGWAAGLVLADQFVQLGLWGRLLGFCVAWPYFGLLNSSLSGGQTLGKRALGIKVVSQQGGFLSVQQALVRFLPLGAAWFLNGAPWSEAVLLSFWSYVLSVAVFGVGLSVAYLFVFNRATRQSLHDLMVGSLVVRAVGSQEESVKAQPTWPVHLAVCGVLMVGSAILPYFGQRAAGNATFSPLLSIYKAVNATSWVSHAQVNQGQSFIVTADKGKVSSTYLSIVAYTKDADINSTTRAGQLAKLALSADPAARQLDTIQVVLVYGYDIGIAASWQSRNQSHTPAEWLAQ
ncbi:MAG: RDD family protein [Aquabacterium sp.]|uniref:RDD family protein n=1 Tax=Aquabacterium sp. TaxID=1872578 RepID=UPI0025B97F47|nr:RDD family protein [Aquabacterium sp.]MBI5926353.1 RDD family protein [Aquabacterium sp.]